MGWPSGLRRTIGNRVCASTRRFESCPHRLFMRTIFLNSWYAKAGRDFYDFISKNSPNTDIFCLSEIHPRLFSELNSLLPDFQGFYEEGKMDKYMGFVYGQAVFARRGIKILDRDKMDIFRNVYNDLGWATVFGLGNPKRFYLANIHGKARPGHKLDTPARLRQSERIIKFFKDKKWPKIIGGDFNLMPQTKSVRMFEEAGYRNLIKDFKIKRTRNRLTWEQFPNEEKQYFADYVFVSPEVKVKKFKVPHIETSDHLPLILEFEI